MMSRAVTLLFGIGAPKAGTSWLHRYLSGHPDCHFPAQKESHYFDRLARSKTHPDLSLHVAEAEHLQNRIAVVERRWTKRQATDWVPEPERFTQDAADRITRFLGLSPLPAPIAVKVHEGLPLRLDAARRARACDLLAPQYAFGEEFFGDRLPREWRTQMVEV